MALPDHALTAHPDEVVEVADESPEALWGLLDARGWGDGLPVVAPTRARVEGMLAAAGDPDELLGVVPPRDGAATLRTVAVNAVLAGCPPSVLPVVAAAVRALTRPEVNLRGVQATTHPVAPLVIVHGDAVERGGFNAGVGAFGPGHRANATVGRAVRFVLLHVGGARPGAGDAATQGQPSKYTYCVAEHAAASPWPAYHRSRGVDAASAVTVACGENPHNVHDMESDEPVRLLTKAASVMATLGSNNACISQGEFFVVLGPEHAATIAAHGWSRGDVQSFLYERARRPRGELRRAFEAVAWAPWLAAIEDDDALLPMTDDPDNVRVLVAGGPGKHSCVIPSWGMTRSVTVAVEP
ncbi:MAG TPA: hypothetical protein VG869_03910 [Acidimicrobiia bacterium]|jgi:hypothetical protein|nr:hypothetical protein [Acidimicrobiia bacterium]HEV3450329.1 hypothetical protein [Acidimicrobiia bacterium]